MIDLSPRISAEDVRANAGRESDLVLMATLDAYIAQVTREAGDAETARARLRAIEGQIQAALDMATKHVEAA
jgi:hypothetical protein